MGTPRHDPVDLVIRKLEAGGFDPRSAGSGKWKSRCPVHQGRRYNLCISTGDDGRALLHCKHVDESGNGCSSEEIVATLGLEWNDLFVEDDPGATGRSPRPSPAQAAKARKPKSKPGPKPRPRGYPTAEAAIAALEPQLGPCTFQWDYPGADGAVVAQVVRFDGNEGKTFRPIQFDRASGSWRVEDPPGLWPLYQLPEILRADDKRAVWFLEGEKCTEILRRLGLIATTTAHGAQSPSKTDLSPLSGRTVYLLPDHDAAGEGYATILLGMFGSLDPRPRVKVVRLPVPNDGDDVEQWVESQPDPSDPAAIRAELKALVDGTSWVDWGAIPPPGGERQTEESNSADSGDFSSTTGDLRMPDLGGASETGWNVAGPRVTRHASS